MYQLELAVLALKINGVWYGSKDEEKGMGKLWRCYIPSGLDSS